MKIIVTYSLHHSRWFSDIAQVLHQSFSNYYESILQPVSHLNSLYDSSCDIIFVIAPHGFQELGKGEFNRNPSKKYIAWDLEQTPYLGFENPITLNRFKRTLNYYSKYDLFMTESPEKSHYFCVKGYPTTTLPFGYHTHYSRHMLMNAPIYDVFFTGTLLPRRVALLNSLKQDGITIYPNMSNLFDPLAKANAISTCRICLNVHFNEAPYFEKPRIIQDIIANEGFCITETIAYPEGFENCGWVMCDYSELKETIKEWIPKSKDKERKERAKSTLEYIKKEHTMDKYVEQCLKEWAQ